ncbi:MAG: electron transfer flavoprotein subunit beta/FixA family protein [Chlorobi bacterium]|nr:electron transfer flavoprotein subunit beta/FixA family protein [Chlorobiota bacterium]
MNIFVCISHVPDSTTKVRVGPSGKEIDEEGVTFILNPYDEYAVEAALQMKEKQGGEVTAVCVGNDAVKETIRKALAMGVDKGLLIKAERSRDSFGIAHAIADTLRDRSPDVIFCGKQSIDYDSSQVAGMLGELLGFPSVSAIVGLEVDGDGNITLERDIEGGQEISKTKLPAVLSTDKGLNEPRYPKLQGIMAAKRKPIEETEAAPYENRVQVMEMRLPPAKDAGKIVGEGVDAVPELVKLLHEEAKVI